MQQQCTTALKNAKKKFKKSDLNPKKSDLKKNLIFRFFIKNHDFFPTLLAVQFLQQDTYYGFSYFSCMKSLPCF